MCNNPDFVPILLEKSVNTNEKLTQNVEDTNWYGIKVRYITQSQHHEDEMKWNVILQHMVTTRDTDRPYTQNVGGDPRLQTPRRIMDPRPSSRGTKGRETMTPRLQPPSRVRPPRMGILVFQFPGDNALIETIPKDTEHREWIIRITNAIPIPYLQLRNLFDGRRLAREVTVDLTEVSTSLDRIPFVDMFTYALGHVKNEHLPFGIRLNVRIFHTNKLHSSFATVIKWLEKDLASNVVIQCVTNNPGKAQTEFERFERRISVEYIDQKQYLNTLNMWREEMVRPTATPTDRIAEWQKETDVPMDDEYSSDEFEEYVSLSDSSSSKGSTRSLSSD